MTPHVFVLRSDEAFASVCRSRSSACCLLDVDVPCCPTDEDGTGVWDEGKPFTILASVMSGSEADLLIFLLVPALQENDRSSVERGAVSAVNGSVRA